MNGSLLDPRSGWIEMVDDLGPTVSLMIPKSPGLDARLTRRGVQLVERSEAASTLVVDEGSLAMVESIAADVTVVCLITNRRSPLTWIDTRVAGRSATLGEVCRRVQIGGRATRVFGVLRSTSSPLALIPFDAPRSSALVRSALGLHVGRSRQRLFDIASRLGPIGQQIFPGWLVIAHGVGRDPGLDPRGQIGYKQSVGCTRVLGEPPQYIEREAPLAELANEAQILDRLADSPMASFVPKVVSAPDRHVLRPGGRAPSLVTSVIPGQSLRPRDMSDRDLETWTERAARLLKQLQSLDDAADIVVHGDYWLGNLLVEGEQIVGIIDWETAHRGPAGEDEEFLSISLTAYLGRDSAFTERIRAAVRRGLAD